jgi:tetratricopeptide (TPR) repeat protein
MTPEQLGRDTTLAVLQRARSSVGALPVARSLAAAFPGDAEVQEQLGWVESAAGRYTDAARSLARASRLGADTAYAAAEHYRAARRYREALDINARIGDRSRRATQRFDILFESGRMARAITAAEALNASGELDPRRRYNLAYAHYSLRQFAEASRLARSLEGTPDADRARALLRAMGR